MWRLFARFSKQSVKKRSLRQRSPRAVRSRWKRPSFRAGLFLISFLIFFVLFCLAGWLGYPQKFLTFCQDRALQGTIKLGFVVDDIFVEGRCHAPRETILEAIHAKRGDGTLSIDVENVRENLEKIDWIKSVIVRRRLPNVLYINLRERQPIALWQQQKNLYLIDSEGVVIKTPILSHFQTLPIVIGTDAPAHTPRILSILSKFPDVFKRITSLNRIRERRWDFMIDQTIQIKLPEDRLEESLARLTLLLQQEKIIAGEVLIVDLRLPKQIIIRLTPAAALRLKGGKGKEI